MNLVVVMQAEFQVRFNIDEVNSMATVGEMADLILKKIS